MTNPSAKRYRIKSRDDLEEFWHGVRNVPARSRRSKRDEERYALALFLRARAEVALLDFPLFVAEGESPDFVITEPDSRCVGLEVTRATSRKIQKWMTEAEKRLPETSSILLSPHGWAGDSAEREWLRFFEGAIEEKLRKLPKFRRAERYDLLIYDDTPLPSPDRKSVIQKLAKFVRARRAENPRLGEVSLIISLDVIYDVGGAGRTLSFINASAPESESDFGERIEHAARVAIRRGLDSVSHE